MSRERREQNRRSWNQATPVHNRHKRDQARFLREGGSTLFPEELDLLGPLTGRSLLHLQCNAGQDTLSLARQGATVTGVDISDAAIEFARGLARDSGIEATFERADVYDWLAGAAGERAFDRVFSSYGAVPWLSDLAAWAHGVAAVLAPGGRFALVEFHPVALMFDEDWRLSYPYARGESAIREAGGIGDYVGASGAGLAPSGFVEASPGFENPEPSWEFYWSPLDVAAALVDVGLRLTRLHEYPHVNGARMWNGMRELPDRRFLPPENVPPMPLMYGLVAERDGGSAAST